MRRFGLKAASLLALVFWTFGAAADTADQDIEPPVLVVADDTGEHAYTIQQLRDIGEESFVTTTIWTEGVQEFTGVPLHSFVKHLGLTEGEFTARAVNDYAITFPVADALEEGAIIAYLRNGELMPVRDKGPLWIVYPFDSSPGFQTEVLHARSIWQLERIEIGEQ